MLGDLEKYEIPNALMPVTLNVFAGKGPRAQVFVCTSGQLARNYEDAFSGPNLNRTRASAVRKISALSDLDKISVRIADVAAYLAVLRNRLRDELRSPAFP